MLTECTWQYLGLFSICNDTSMNMNLHYLAHLLCRRIWGHDSLLRGYASGHVPLDSCLAAVINRSYIALAKLIYNLNSVSAHVMLYIVMMHLTEIVAILLVLSEVPFPSEGQNLKTHSLHSTCPVKDCTWTTYNNHTHTCECGSTNDHIVSCKSCKSDNDGCPFEVRVLNGFCITWNKNGTETIVGACLFNRNKWYEVYSVIPSNLSQLEQTVCGFINRTGQLCGQCVEGYSPPVYSYYPQCVKCTSGTNNWAKYLVVSLLPTTVFFIGVLVFRFRVTSPLLSSYVLVCQVVTSSSLLRKAGYSVHTHPLQHRANIAGNIIISLPSIWNLDFFRLLYFPFCLHSNASTLQVLSLDYIIAAYPLSLILLTYTLVRLHYHNCTLVVWLCRPFIGCFARCRRQWNIQNSLVDAFATFLLLSYVKFLSVSFDILVPAFLWDMNGGHQKTVLYYDGTVEYFKYKHIPYGLLAVAILLVFTFFPILLLCLYPLRCFQRFLNRYHLSSQTLHTFMDTFQGSFKDGTNGTRDCRSFAAIYLIIRVAILLSLGFWMISFSMVLEVTLPLLVVLLLSCIQPYRNSFYTKLDIIMFLSLAVYMASMWAFSKSNTKVIQDTGRIILIVLLPLVVIYPLSLLLYSVCKRSRQLQAAVERIRAYLRRQNNEDQLLEESLPSRIMDETSNLLEKTRNRK